MNPKFNFVLDKDLDQPLYKQLYENIYSLIEKGLLKGDEKLPPIRTLKEALGINQVTVVNAYKKLESEGYVYKISGSGCFVSNVSKFNFKNSNIIKRVLVDELYNFDDLDEGLLSDNHKHSRINFSSTSPSIDLFPIKDFKSVISEVLETEGANAFGYHESLGNINLRKNIVTSLFEKGIHTHESEIIIVSGTQQGIDVISKTLLKKGDFVLTESPTYSGAVAIFKSRDANIIDIEMTNDGPFIDYLEKQILKYKPKLFYTIPDFQNPTGISWSIEKRKAVLALAEKYDFFILEDGYISELDYAEAKRPSLYEIDQSNSVIYAKSFSRFLLPGVRLGYMILPESLKSKVMITKHITDISSSGLMQTAMDLFIKKGYWEKHTNHLIEIYKNRYEEIMKYKNKLNKLSITFTPPEGGLNIWLKIGSKQTGSEITQKLSKKNILITPGSIFHSNTLDLNKFLRLSFAATEVQDIKNGIENLLEIL